MEIIYIFIAMAAFVGGFMIGKNKKYKACNKANKKPTDKITAEWIREYENFLNYDGSEQK